MEEEKTVAELACPLRYALGILGGRWKLPILCILSDRKEKRYSEIKRRLPEITNMMLAQSLKELERDGMITRRQFNEVPPHVEYKLSDEAEELREALVLIARWAKGRMVQEMGEGAFRCGSMGACGRAVE